MSTWAVVPVKQFASAKTRLHTVLSSASRAAIARSMARDVLAALAAARRLDGCLVTGGEDARRLAAETGCDWLSDDGAADMSTAISMAAAQLGKKGVRTMLVIPGDLPALRADDIDELLSMHHGGVSLCRAARDGGTNALLLTPPDAIDPHFGQNSARLHLQAAVRAGLSCQQLTLPAFARDIDTPQDLRLLNAGTGSTQTGQLLATLAQDIDNAGLPTAAATS